MSRIKASVYTKGKFGKGYRETFDENCEFLYSHGIYPTKIREQDLPEWYCPIHARVISYMYGFVNTKGVKEIGYTYVKENHLFKDDYLYISYGDPLIPVYANYGDHHLYDYKNGTAIDGLDILDLILYIEHFSPDVDTSNVRKLIDEKIKYLHEKEQSYYEGCFGTSELVDVWEYYRKGLPKFE